MKEGDRVELIDGGILWYDLFGGVRYFATVKSIIGDEVFLNERPADSFAITLLRKV